jgi:hypothetical protein
MMIGSRNSAEWHYFAAKSLIWQQIFEKKTQAFRASLRKFADLHLNDIEQDSFSKMNPAGVDTIDSQKR